jgi:phospholipid-binding lipoprotein MlaA
LFTTPTRYVPGRYDLPNYMVMMLLYNVNTRANLLPADSLMESQFDTYLFVRTAYLQRRQAQVYDGNPPPEDLGINDIDDTSEPAESKPGGKRPEK